MLSESLTCYVGLRIDHVGKAYIQGVTFCAFRESGEIRHRANSKGTKVDSKPPGTRPWQTGLSRLTASRVFSLELANWFGFPAGQVLAVLPDPLIVLIVS